MLGQSAFTRGSSSTADSRIFVYEVTGLHQNNVVAQPIPQIRTSANTFIQVPYNRMNEKMRQILRMGGRIVNIYPQGEKPQAAEAES
jgi:phycocyanin-associated, rod